MLLRGEINFLPSPLNVLCSEIEGANKAERRKKFFAENYLLTQKHYMIFEAIYSCDCQSPGPRLSHLWCCDRANNYLPMGVV